MQNTNPKSELPAMKERAKKDKDEEARQKSIDKEGKSRAGRNQPIAHNNTAEGRARNRPVDLDVSNAPKNGSLAKERASGASVHSAKENALPYTKK
jgi:hypothetical protein